MINVKAVLEDIDAALDECKALFIASKCDDHSDIDHVALASVNTRLASTIERYSDPSSRYVKNLQQTIATYRPDAYFTIEPLAGVLSALRKDIAEGRLASVMELIHADVFSDFLDMADHLMQEGYKDPAAVLTGGVLEEHLRKLCAKHGLDTTTPSGAPKKADTMNSDLAKVPAYSKMDQKNVTAWLGLRNDAAHGRYGSYTGEQVRLFTQSVRDFISRVSA